MEEEEEEKVPLYGSHTNPGGCRRKRRRKRRRERGEEGKAANVHEHTMSKPSDGTRPASFPNRIPFRLTPILPSKPKPAVGAAWPLRNCTHPPHRRRARPPHATQPLRVTATARGASPGAGELPDTRARCPYAAAPPVPSWHSQSSPNNNPCVVLFPNVPRLRT